jgi:hypothetical protein
LPRKQIYSSENKNKKIKKTNKRKIETRWEEDWRQKIASDSRKLCAINTAFDCSEFDGIYEQIIIVQRRTKAPKNETRVQREKVKVEREIRSRPRRTNMMAAAAAWSWYGRVRGAVI